MQRAKGSAALEEYRRMFNLSAQELELKIVGCADGPASFNFEMNKLGHQVISCDPLYEHTGVQIGENILPQYEQGKAEGRYLTESLPTLPFGEQKFDLALCSHFLFLYTHALTGEFHLASIKELVRVAREVRIFPILDFDGNQSEYVDDIKQELGREGYLITVEKVDYAFQKGGNMMMKVGGE